MRITWEMSEYSSGIVGLEDRVEHALLGDFLGLEVFRVIEHFAVAVAEDVVENQPLRPSMAGLEAGSDDGLISV